MNRAQIQIVRRRLDDYGAYKALAFEADRKALETQARIDALAGQSSPVWDKLAPSQSHLDLAKKLNALISEQGEYDRDACRWRRAMLTIERYIASFQPSVRNVMRLRFIEGLSYDELEEVEGMSCSGLKNVIYRALEASDFGAAQELL